MSTGTRYVDVVFNLPAKKSFCYQLPQESECGVGYRVSAPFSGRTLRGFVVGEPSERPPGDFEIKEIDTVSDDEPVFGTDLLDLAGWMAGMYLCSLGEALGAMIPGGRKESRLSVGDEIPDVLPDRLDLNPAQEDAIAAVLEGGPGLYYLFGVTGSGKTEVYLRIAESVLLREKSAIYLVPEIALTHELVHLLHQRFGTRIGLIHSRLTPSQRLREWGRIRRGEATFVVGARSAIFAPAKDLGLIIVDEEHEGSYKSSSTPRYHARQVAMKRRALSDATLVMGSATPSAEAFHLMGEGQIARCDLPERITGGRMPEITIVDMRGENGMLSRLLVDRMRETADLGRQIILFLNRRGFSHFFHCRSCGYEMKCRQCSVSLTYHKNKHRMLCHYCGYSAEPVQICPDCGSLDVGYSGFGTEMIEEEIGRVFPDLSSRRIDTDAVRKKGALKSALDDFRDGKINVLLGTQMVAKGLNFPGVKLVGVVMADTGLHLPDFRAQERTFSLITQVAGRAGRFMPDGEVIIQTYQPENDAIRLAATGDLTSFYEGELNTRRMLAFPPFSRLIRLVVRGKNQQRVARAAEVLVRVLRSRATDAFEILGPAECPLAMVAGNYRYHVLVRTGSFGQAHRAVAESAAEFQAPSGIYLEVDVDPTSLL